MVADHPNPSKAKSLDDCKGQIWRLYKIEKKSLSDVSKVIESEHGLAPKKWKYKAKLEQWNFHKNVKRKDLFDAMRESEVPISPNDAQYKIRRTMDKKAIIKYAKRNQIRINKEVLVSWQGMDHSKTPGPSRPFDQTATVAIPERFLHSIRDFVQGSFEADTWRFNGNDSIIDSSRRQNIERKSLHDFLSEIDIGCTIAQTGDKDLAFKHWNNAFDDVHILIKGTYHDHLPNIIQKLNDLKRRGYSPVAVSLQNHITQLSRIYERKGYTSSRLYSHLAALDLDQLEEFEERLMTLFHTWFNFYLGETCYNSFVMMMNAANRKLTRCPWIGLDEVLPSLHALETRFGPTDRRALDVLRLRLETLSSRERYMDMIMEGPVLVDRTKKITNDAWLQSYFATKGYYLLGTAQWRLGDYASAYENLTEAASQELAFRNVNETGADIFSPERRHIEERRLAIEQMMPKPNNMGTSRSAMPDSNHDVEPLTAFCADGIVDDAGPLLSQDT